MSKVFPFIDAPDPRLVRDGYRLLRELRAIDASGRLSKLGKKMARLPVDPRLARILVAASHEACLSEVLVIVSAIAAGDVRDRPHDRQQAADEAHAAFNDKRSDFLSHVKIWQHLDAQLESLSASAFKKYCRANYFNYRRWREWGDIYRQTRLALRELRLEFNSDPADYDAIHRALLSGLLDHLGRRNEDNSYTGSRRREFRIFPGSGLRRKPPKWVAAAEITETSRVYARTIASIDPAWVEDIGAHLIKRQYSEPHWRARAGRGGIFEKLTLNGLTIVERRRTELAPVDPQLARELFIRHALVYDDWRTKLEIIQRNRECIASVHAVEAKTRRRDLLVDEAQIFSFYDARLPPDIVSGAKFEQWLRSLPDSEILRLDRDAIIQRPINDDVEGHYPDTWRQGPLELPLSYCFEPGNEQDGVTLTVPMAVANQVDAAQCEWLVPGLLQEKIEALIRALPKRLRKHFVPAPDFAAAIFEALRGCGGDLRSRIVDRLLAMTGIEVDISHWENPIAQHLRMRFALVDEHGEIIATGRDLEHLRQSAAAQIAAQAPAWQQNDFEREGITQWDFDELPDHVQCEAAGYRIQRFPALVDEGEAVSLRLFDDFEQAQEQSRLGIRRLLFTALKSERRYLDKHLNGANEFCLQLSPICSARELIDDVFLTAIDRIFELDIEFPRDSVAFAECLAQRRDEFVPACQSLAAVLHTSAVRYARIRAQLLGDLELSRIEVARDIEFQLRCMFYPGFIRHTPAQYFEHFPRYLEAIERRLGKVDTAPDKDRHRRAIIEPLLARVFALDAPDPPCPAYLSQYRWLLEEYRVSLFAQELGTAEKVSAGRLDKLWESISRT